MKTYLMDAIWHAMKEWYERKVVSGDIVKTERAKLKVLDLLPKGNANTYIATFLKLKKELEDVGERDHPSTLIEWFLDQIKYPLYDIMVMNLQMNNSKTTSECGFGA